jgi:hypothetical protein
MALTKCHECGQDVSTQAKACPTCGAQVKKPSGTRLLLFLLAVPGALGLIGLATRDRSTSDLPSGPPAHAPAPTSTTTPLATPPADAPRPTAEAPTARVLKEFPSYRTGTWHRRNVVVSPGLSLDALTALAKRLHADDPQSIFQVFTSGDEAQFRRFMQWDLHYTRPDAARYPKPQKWMDQHLIAMIARTGYVPRRPGALWFQLTVFKGDAVRPTVPEGHTVNLE